MGLFEFPLSKGIDGVETFLLLAVFCFIALVLLCCTYFLLRKLIYHLMKNETRENTTTSEAASAEVGIINDDIIDINDVKIIKNDSNVNDVIVVNDDICCTAEMIENDYYIATDGPELLEIQCIQTNRNGNTNSVVRSFLRRSLENIRNANNSHIVSNRPFCI